MMERETVLELSAFIKDENDNWTKEGRAIKKENIIQDNPTEWRKNFTKDDRLDFIQNAVNLGMRYKVVEKIVRQNFNDLFRFDREFNEAFNFKINNYEKEMD